MAKKEKFLWRVKNKRTETYLTSRTNRGFWSSRGHAERQIKGRRNAHEYQIEKISLVPAEVIDYEQLIEEQRLEAQSYQGEHDNLLVELNNLVKEQGRNVNKLEALIGTRDITLGRRMLATGIMEGEGAVRLKEYVGELDKANKEIAKIKTRLEKVKRKMRFMY